MGLAAIKEAEQAGIGSDPDNGRIDFVEGPALTGLHVARERACPEPNDVDSRVIAEELRGRGHRVLADVGHGACAQDEGRNADQEVLLHRLLRLPRGPN